METLETKRKASLGEINHRNDQTVIHQAVKDLAARKRDEEGISKSETMIIGPAPGKKGASTWVYHDPERKESIRSGRDYIL